MAGHRKERGSERAIVRSTRRRRDWFDQALAQARTPSDQVGEAARYARGVLTLLAGEPEAAQLSDDIVRAVKDGCDQAVAAVVKRRGRRAA